MLLYYVSTQYNITYVYYYKMEHFLHVHHSKRLTSENEKNF